MRHLRPALFLGLAILLVGCTTAAPAGPPTGPGASSRPGGGTDPGSGGGADGNTGSGVMPPGGGVLPGNPLLGNARVVFPRPGQLDVRSVNVQLVRAATAGRQVRVELRWWSGVEPCSILDSVVVTRGDHSIHLVVREGSGPPPVPCVDIAQLKATVVDLGELEPGSWTIDADGDAAPVHLEL